MNDPALKDKAWSVAFEYVLRRSWLTSRQIKHAMEFGWKAANRAERNETVLRQAESFGRTWRESVENEAANREEAK